MTAARLLWLAALLLPACVTLPKDPFAAAEQARQRGDLAAALAGYDRVPIGHPHCPEARSAAAVVERCMRHSHELLLQGMQLRDEGREPEALERLQQARAGWPLLAGVQELIRATESRMQWSQRSAAGSGHRPPVAGPVVAPVSAAVVVPVAPPAAPVAEVATALPGPVAAVSAPDPALATRLVGIEDMLARGKVDEAIAVLGELAGRTPVDPRVGNRLGRLLRQRGLLRYGQGILSAAVADWRRTQELSPDPEVARMLVQAEAELAGRK